MYKIKLSLILFVVFGLGACASSPELITFPTESGATQYFFPMTAWTPEQKELTAVCDITYRYAEGSLAIVNISFAYTGKANTGKIPSLPTAITFSGDGASYPLSGIELLLTKPEANLIRITSTMNGDALLLELRSQSIGMVAAIDGTEYRFSPSKDFFTYRDLFLQDIALRTFK